MEEEFYASIKLITGEEIFSKVFLCEKNNSNMLLLFNPIIVTNYKHKNGKYGYKIEPWLKTTTEDMFLLDFNNVITMSESNDFEMINMHQSYIKKISNLNSDKPQLTREMGYISNIKDAKKMLENIYKNL